jgi:hypothetical protein
VSDLFGSPPTPPPPPAPPAVTDTAAVAQSQADSLVKRKGAAASILTSQNGQPNMGQTATKVLLGS